MQSVLNTKPPAMPAWTADDPEKDGEERAAVFHDEAPDLWHWGDIHQAVRDGREIADIAEQYKCSIPTINKIVSIQISIEKDRKEMAPA